MILKPANAKRAPSVAKTLESTEVKDLQVPNSVSTMKSQCSRVSNPHMRSAAFMSRRSIVEID